jgi:hypothetical protein
VPRLDSCDEVIRCNAAISSRCSAARQLRGRSRRARSSRRRCSVSVLVTSHEDGKIKMQKLLLSSVAALSVLSAPAAHAQQKNMPKPAQALPSYPPVVCVTPNWTPESCARRLTKTVLSNDPGGYLRAHRHRWRELAQSGSYVEIRGACMSACTLIMAYVPNDRLCFSESGSLVFHIYRESGPKGEPSVKLTQWTIDQLPQDIRNWIIAKGGVEKMTLQPWTLNAAELWAMGYRKCEPEPPPVPTTTRPHRPT